jgi:hypothetical protein
MSKAGVRRPECGDNRPGGGLFRRRTHFALSPHFGRFSSAFGIGRSHNPFPQEAVPQILACALLWPVGTRQPRFARGRIVLIGLARHLIPNLELQGKRPLELFKKHPCLSSVVTVPFQLSRERRLRRDAPLAFGNPPVGKLEARLGESPLSGESHGHQ